MKPLPFYYLIALMILMSCHGNQAHKQAEQSQPGIKVSIMYPNNDDVRFGMDYYSQQHMPMLAQLFGSKMIRYEIDQGVGGRAEGEKAPFVAIGHLYFEKLSHYQEAFGTHSERILGDIPNYTNVQPVVQISELVP